jgi:fibronectin-binding autotransporter adhesin
MTSGTRINSDSNTLRLTGILQNNGNDTNNPIDVQFGGAGSISYAGVIQQSINKVRYDGTGTLTLVANNLNNGVIATSGTVAHSGFAGQGLTSGDPTGHEQDHFVADFIQLSGGAVLKYTKTGNAATVLQNNKGIQLGAGGGKWDDIADGTSVHIYRGVISGTGPFTKQGGGILSITSANTYSGATNINAGTLRIRNEAAFGTGGLPSGTPLTVAAGGTFDMNVSGTNQVVGSLNGAGAITAPASSTSTRVPRRPCPWVAITPTRPSAEASPPSSTPRSASRPV